MNYIQVSISSTDAAIKEILIAQLSELGFDGFEEKDTILIAYISSDTYNAGELNAVMEPLGLGFEIIEVPSQNWNQLWEDNFQAVIIDNLCTIRADFHDITVTTPYEIIVTPKMSFGTGHHATTQLMMLSMQDLIWAGKKVMDFGTGTGILAIFAEMLGASEIVAIDNDEWSVSNAAENIARNKCSKISLALGTLSEYSNRTFDIILANINRNILLENMGLFHGMLSTNGNLILSGLLAEDEEVICAEAAGNSFKLLKEQHLNGWICLMFEKV